MIDKQLSDTKKMTSILKFAVITTLTVVILPGCSTSVQKGEKASATNEATAFEADIEAFKKVAYEEIAAHEMSIAKFEDGIVNILEEDKTDYKKTVLALEKTNQDLRYRMDNCKADGKENWEIFRTEFTRDLNNLDAAFKDFTSTISKTNNGL